MLKDYVIIFLAVLFAFLIGAACVQFSVSNVMNITDWISSFATILTAIIAWIGVNTWKKQNKTEEINNLISLLEGLESEVLEMNDHMQSSIEKTNASYSEEKETKIAFDKLKSDMNRSYNVLSVKWKTFSHRMINFQKIMQKNTAVFDVLTKNFDEYMGNNKACKRELDGESAKNIAKGHKVKNRNISDKLFSELEVIKTDLYMMLNLGK